MYFVLLTSDMQIVPTKCSFLTLYVYLKEKTKKKKHSLISNTSQKVLSMISDNLISRQSLQFF